MQTERNTRQEWRNSTRWSWPLQESGVPWSWVTMCHGWASSPSCKAGRNCWGINVTAPEALLRGFSSSRNTGSMQENYRFRGWWMIQMTRTLWAHMCPILLMCCCKLQATMESWCGPHQHSYGKLSALRKTKTTPMSMPQAWIMVLLLFKLVEVYM